MPTGPIRQPLSGGFTLVEVMVVLLIVAVMLGMVGIGSGALNLISGGLNGHGSDREVIQRLSLALARASDIAQTTGHSLRVELATGSYRFLVPDAMGRWVRVENDAWLGERPVPEGWRWEAMTFDGEVLDVPFRFQFDGEPVRFELDVISAGASYKLSGNSAGMVSWKEWRPSS